MCSFRADCQVVPSAINEDSLPIERQLNEPKSDELEKKRLIEENLDNGKPEIEVDSAIDNQSNASNEDTKIYLKELKIVGVTQLPNELLSEKLDPYVGQYVTYKDLLKIAYEVTQLYQERGYLTTRTIIPPQKIEENIVYIQVIEGSISKVKIEGNHYVRKAYIEKQLHLKENGVFQIGMLEKDIIKLNQDKLFSKVKAVLAPGEETGTSEIILQVEDKQPYHLSLGYDNMGRQLIGFYRYSATLTHDNLLGFGDSLVANVATSTNYNTKSLFYQYKFPLNTTGWTIGASHSLSTVDIGGKFSKFNIGSTSNRLSVFTELPLIQTSHYGVTFNAALNTVDASTVIDGTSLKNFTHQPFDSVRALNYGLTFNEQDTKGRTILKTGFENGIDWLGGNQKYSKYNADIIRVQSLPKGIVWLLRGNGQWSFQNLTSLVQYQVGGASTVRGYREGAIIGDRGYSISSEWRVPLYGLSDNVKKRFQGVVFFDHGGAFIQGSDFQADASGTPGYLTSMGLGIRGSVTRFLTGAVDVAMVLTSRKSEPDFRVHFNIGSQLF